MNAQFVRLKTVEDLKNFKPYITSDIDVFGDVCYTVHFFDSKIITYSFGEATDHLRKGV